MAKIEQLLEDAYDEVRADVVAEWRSHPEYQQLVKQLATQGWSELLTLVTRA